MSDASDKSDKSAAIPILALTAVGTLLVLTLTGQLDLTAVEILSPLLGYLIALAAIFAVSLVLAIVAGLIRLAAGRKS